MEVGIAGAGIGGLAAAALVAEMGHRVVVFERFAEPGPVGAGLVVQPVGLAVLDRLGVGGTARALGATIRRMRGVEARTGRLALDVAYGGEGGLAMHRAALSHALWQAVAARGVAVEPGRTVAGHEHGRLLFADGARSATFDLLVDATGARSALSPLRARDLGYGALWGVVDWVDGVLPADGLSQRYRRADRMAGVLPIGRLPGDPVPKAAVFWSLRGDAHGAWAAGGLTAWRDEVAALWPEAGAFFGQVDQHERLTMARYAHGRLRRPWGDGIAYLGDAAHRASPQLGQGANMALLDAWALALALDHAPGRDRLDEALRLYGRSRRAHVAAYQALSALFTPQYQSDSRWLPVLRDRVLSPLSRVPPAPRVLGALVEGRLVPPLGRLTPKATHGAAEPVPA